jgi:hypothetical protein
MLLTLLDEWDVNDGNAHRWIRTSADLRDADGTLTLTVSGVERAVEALNRFDDPNIAGKYNPAATPKSRGKGQVANPAASSNGGVQSKGASKRGVSTSARSASWNAAWKNADAAKLGVRAALLQLSTREKGLVGLWAIRTAAGEDGKVVTRLQLAQFLLEAFELKINDATIGEALKHPSLKNWVIHLEGTKFQITTDGMAHAEQLVRSGGAKDTSADAKDGQ